MIIEKILEKAAPYLEGRTIKDAVIGISLLGIQLDNGHLGISYVLREDLDPGCSVFPYAATIIGKDAKEVAHWALTGDETLQRAIGVAVLTAASHQQDLKDGESPDRPFGVEFKETDTVGMIGLIVPVMKMLSPRVKAVLTFDKGISESIGSYGNVLPMEKQSSVLPQCDIVLISGTTTINGTIDSLLDMCDNAREIIMVGPSTPMYPEAFKDTKVTVLAGSWWKSGNKDKMWKAISMACGNQDLGQSVIKKTVRVKE